MKIFACNTGASGSFFFSQVFSRFTNIPSYHEPLPRGAGLFNEAMNHPAGTISYAQGLIDWKIQVIKEHSRDGDYFESSQMFIKAWVHPFLSEFSDVRCIYIQRNILDYLLACYRKGGRSGWPLDWLLLPEWRGNILRTTPGLSFMEICAWNWHEVRARFMKHKSQFSKSYEFDFGKINDPDEWNKMLDHMEIPHEKIITSALLELGQHPTAKKQESVADTMEAMRRDWKIEGSRGMGKYKRYWPEIQRNI